MGTARYEFKPDREYVGRVSDVRTDDLPGYGRTVRAVRVTLAVPVLLAPDGHTPLPNHAAEAKLWLFPDDEAEDAAVLLKAGITVRGGQYRRPTRPVHLKLRFGKRVLPSRYQPLEECEVYDGRVNPALIPPPSDRRPTGLEFPDGRGVALWRGEKLGLSRHEVQILQALAANDSAPVPPEELRRAVTRWSNRRLDESLLRSMTTAISKLRGRLPESLTIHARDGDKGWVLVADRR